jgi:hypothetical protein
MPEENANELVARQERGEERLGKKKEKMPQHRKSISRIYKEVLEKGVDQLCGKKGKFNSPDVRQE